jgi:hypothetical protein
VQWIGSLRGKPLLPDLGNTGPLGNWLGLGLFFVLCGWIYWDATRAKAAER